jgi:hypothetical protein
MPGYESAVDVELPVIALWARLMDADLAEVRRDLEKEGSWLMRARIHRIEENRALAVALRGPGYGAVIEQVLSPAGMNRSSLLMRVTVTGPLGRLAWLVGRRWVPRFVHHELMHTKAKAEAAEADEGAPS